MRSKRAQARPLLVIGLFGIVAAAIYLFLDMTSGAAFAFAVYFHWAILVASIAATAYSGWLFYQDSRPSELGGTDSNRKKPGNK